MKLDETQRVAVVTGGAQGIGLGVAKTLLQQGWRVVIADADEEACRDAGQELGGLGDLTAIPTDVSREEAVEALFQQVAERWGRLDALVNNAGIADPESGAVEKLSLDSWNRVIGTNLTGMFLCAKHAVPLLRPSGGAMVNIASTRALMSEPDTEAYAASKGGIVALTHALAISLGPEIRVNAISPGWISTEAWKKSSRRSTPRYRDIDHNQHPVGRVGQPEDIADLVAYLLSESAGFITGQNFVVDGGMTRKMIYAH